MEEGEAVNSLKDQTRRGKVSAKKSHDKSFNKRRENADRNARNSSPNEVLRCNSVVENIVLPRKVAQRLGKCVRFAEE